MENLTLMNWQTFKSLLAEHSSKHLQFQYAKNKLINASYHITEIKLAPITSVDCGGKLNKWTEVIIQILEPSITDNQRSMKISKALSIIDLVEKNITIDPNAVVKIEFGNAEFDTRQMYPNQFIELEDSLTIDLRPDFTQCKASTNGSCGSKNTDEECCTSSEKPEETLKNLTTSCCESSGCCA